MTLLAWGALAFGAEYSWAYWPLLVFGIVTSVLAARVAHGGGWPSKPIVSGLSAALAAVLVQVVPIPGRIRDAITGHPPSVDYVVLFDAVTRQALFEPKAAATLSIAPERTALGLMFLFVLVILTITTTAAFSVVGTRPIVRSVMVLGVMVAFVGLIQGAFHSEWIYGFWRPPKPGIAFAPFVNENHFAGWMVMTMSLAIGWLAGGIAQATEDVVPGWRNRLLWFASLSASDITLTALAVAIMALSIVVTFSRGGLVGLVTAVAITGFWVSRRQLSPTRRVLSAASVIAIFLAAAIRGGVGETLAEIGSVDVDWAGRRDIWLQTLRMIRDYPATGTGLNTFGIAMLHYQSGVPAQRVIEAHNDYLQLAAEGGLLLVIPIVVTIALVIREIKRRFREGVDDQRTYWMRAGAVTGLVAIAVMEVFDFTLQMPGAAVMFAVLVAIAVHKPDYLARRAAGSSVT